MPAKITPRYIYWDSCVFLYYINEFAEHIKNIEDVWTEIADEKDARIVTSTLTIAEVAYAASEISPEPLDPETSAKIDALWRNPTIFWVETPRLLMHRARRLIRDAKTRGWTIEPGDAIQLASAIWIHDTHTPISEIHTYDKKWFSHHQALTSIPIGNAKPVKPTLFRLPDKEGTA